MIAVHLHTPHSRGLTLLEALSVVVLLGMTAGLAAATLGRASDDALLRSALASVLAADDAARQIAQTDGGAVLTVNAPFVILTSALGTRSTWSLPAGIVVDIQPLNAPRAGESSTSTLTFNTRGCTRDYTMRLATQDRRTAGLARQVNGATGWSSDMERLKP